MTPSHRIVLCFVLLGLISNGACQLRAGQRDRSRGTFLGNFETLEHDVAGAVWALDDEWLHVEGFTYDGRGPDAFFWVGTEGDQASPRGYIVPFPSGASGEREMVLPAFSGENVLFRLPDGVKVSQLRWISVWCRRFTVNFGSFRVPQNLVLPKKRKLAELSRLAHAVRSGNVTLLDSKTIYIPNLHYDGLGPDAYFWVGKGVPDRSGRKIPNEKKSLSPLEAYEGVDIELVLPDNLTVYDIDYLALWCVKYTENFGDVKIPPAAELFLPPALGQTQVKSGSELQPLQPGAQDQYHTTDERLFPNCVQLAPNFKVEWEAKGDSVEIRLTAEIDENQYMAFGLSPRQGEPVMENSDVVVAYFDSADGSYHAVDYSITARTPCDGTFGVCPDERIGFRNDASVITGERSDGFTSVTYKRPYETGDRHDLPVPEGPQTVVAAIGSLNVRKEAKYHTQFVTKQNLLLDLRGKGTNTCRPRTPASSAPARYDPWPASVIRNTYNFSVNIGPTGGDRGYTALTSTPSWGIAWWVNEMLIPEIYVIRGQTYHFVIEGGDDPTKQASYHPFYITDNKDGGFAQKTKQEQDHEQVFAGVEFTKMGTPRPTAVGRLCKWKHISHDAWKSSSTFEEYRNSLYKDCADGKPGYLEWTVAMDTPDLAYYQCFTHRNLGWKIHVKNPGVPPSERFSGAPATASSLAALLLGVAAAALLR